MKLLLDTNIVLDLLQDWFPFSGDAQAIAELAGQGKVAEYVSASAVTDIYYILDKGDDGRKNARRGLDRLLSVVHILPVTEEAIRYAYQMDWKDFEDSVQYAAAVLGTVDCIITRNKGDYEAREIPVLTPKEFLMKFI